MNARWQSEAKIDAAVRLLSKTVDELKLLKNVEMGLRVYGHQTQFIPGEQDCDDTELLVRIGKGKNIAINNALKKIRPKGTTPIARSLEKAAEDFPSNSETSRNIIILITDGIEACDEDPCAVSLALQSKGVILKPFIIGIGVDPSYESTFQCVGNYFDASNEEVFEQVLQIVISQALNNTSYQLNLNSDTELNAYTNIPVTIINEQNNEVVNRFVHTLNKNGNPDTLTIDPLNSYTVRVHTIPEVLKENLSLEPGQHNLWDFSVPQGTLTIGFSSGRKEYGDISCKVSSANECDTEIYLPINSSEQVLTGLYDLEIATQPPTVLKGIEISEGKVNEVILPSPGNLNLRTSGSGFGGIFTADQNGGKLVKKFNEGNPSGRYILQPGKYTVLFRSRQAKQTLYTFEKEFTITSGSTINIDF